MANVQPPSPTAAAENVSPTTTTGPPTISKMRKRTKTGCLTCRKRRIKCGEERPTCNNCIKSRRQCEGYNQRVVFKPPIGDWPNHPGVISTIQYHTSQLPGRSTQYQPAQPLSPGREAILGSTQGRPFDFANMEANPTLGHAPIHHDPVGGHSYSHDPSYNQPLPSPLHHQPLHSPLHHTPISTATTSYFPQPSPIHTSPTASYTQDPSASYPPPLAYSQSPAYPPSSTSYSGPADSKPTFSQAMPPQPTFAPSYTMSTQAEAERAYRAHASVSPQTEHYPQFSDSRPSLPRYNSQPQIPTHTMRNSSLEMSQAEAYHLPAAVSHADFSHSNFQPVQMPYHDMNSDVKYMPPPVLDQRPAQDQPQLLLQGFGGDDHVSPTQVLDDAAVENEDDDYWDVDTDEEMADIETEHDEDALLSSKDFNALRRIHLENSNELEIRRYDAFLYDGILSQYRPEFAASPLRNPKTLRVFAHYIHVTGPTLSMYERNPRNSTLIFEGAQPPAQQGLWTYILPLRALRHQGLLHAMLAIGSLHIARLQGASITPSYKHYAYSLKRLGRSLSHAKKRLSISTLATSMLLAYYEVWTAEHNKWSTHLVGAAQLVNELDFRSLTREARRLRAAQVAEDRQFTHQNPEMLIDQKQFEQRLRSSIMMPDEDLISTIVGKKVSYDDFGMVMEENGEKQEKKPSLPEKLDLQSFETLQDLYWWYARHDIYQSIVSGNPLINAYRKWSDCPPRAPIGRTDALYGTSDHIVLLIGRITDFTTRDRHRKLKQVEADGGWRPRPGMPGFGPPPGAPGGQPPTPTTPMGPPPHMQAPPPGWSGGPPPGYGGGRRPSMGPPTGPPGPQSRAQPPSGGPPPSAMPDFFGMAPAPAPIPLPPSYENPKYERSPPTPNTPHPKFLNLPAAYESAIAEWNSIVAAHATIAQIMTSNEAFAPLSAELSVPLPGGRGNSAPFGPPLVHRSYDISILWTLLHLAKIILLRSHPAMPPAAQMAAGVCAQATGPYATLIGRICSGMHMPMGDDLSPFMGVVFSEACMPLFFAGIQFQAPDQREWLITRLLEVDRRTGWASAGIIARGCETSWERAASMGRGPQYKRRTRPIGESGPLLLDPEDDLGHNWRSKEKDAYGKGWRDGPGLRDATQYGGSWNGSEGGNEQQGSNDTRFIVRGTRPTWAMNLLGTEEELRAGMEKVGL